FCTTHVHRKLVIRPLSGAGLSTFVHRLVHSCESGTREGAVMTRAVSVRGRGRSRNGSSGTARLLLDAVRQCRDRVERRPIFGSERSVSSRQRYIAIWRALTSTRDRSAEHKASMVIEK